MGKLGKSSGSSVATVWGQMVAAASKGEVVGIVDKHGNAVAVMLGIREYEEMVAELDRHALDEG